MLFFVNVLLAGELFLHLLCEKIEKFRFGYEKIWLKQIVFSPNTFDNQFENFVNV